MILFVPHHYFSVFGDIGFAGSGYESIDGQFYVPLYYEQSYMSNSVPHEVLEQAQGIIYEDGSDEPGANFHFDLEIWFKDYLEEDLEDDEDEEQAPKLVEKQDGVQYLYNPFHISRTDEKKWCPFKLPNLNKAPFTELGDLGKERERFLRLWQPAWWAELSLKDELYSHCKEAEDVALAHIERLKKRFGNRIAAYKFEMEAKEKVIYAKELQYLEIGEDGYVASDYEIPYDLY